MLPLNWVECGIFLSRSIPLHQRVDRAYGYECQRNFDICRVLLPSPTTGSSRNLKKGTYAPPGESCRSGIRASRAGGGGRYAGRTSGRDIGGSVQSLTKGGPMWARKRIRAGCGMPSITTRGKVLAGRVRKGRKDEVFLRLEVLADVFVRLLGMRTDLGPSRVRDQPMHLLGHALAGGRRCGPASSGLVSACPWSLFSLMPRVRYGPSKRA